MVTNIHPVYTLEGAMGMVMVVLMKSSLAIFSQASININICFIVSDFFACPPLCSQNNLLSPRFKHVR